MDEVIEARVMVQALMEGENPMTAEEIAEALDNRVSRRTIYRWAKGETDPQQQSTLKVLTGLYHERMKA